MIRHRVSLRGMALAVAATAFALLARGAAAQQIIIPAPAFQSPPVAVQPTPDAAGVPSYNNGQTPAPQTLPPSTLPLNAGAAPLAPSAASLDDLVSRGRTLENQHRWGEALALYEDAYRSNPALPGIEPRIDLARIHYDLGRRCADGSFRRSLTQVDEARALDLYVEVLAKIDTHYVQNADWQHLVARGTLDLEVAVTEPSFATIANLRATPQEIDNFRRDLHRLADGRAVRDRDEARNLVAGAAHLAQSEIGLSPTATIMEYTTGAAGALDEYSMFLTADQLTDLFSQIEGNFVGLGVELKAADGALLIVNVIHNSPAERAGIKGGDRITAVSGRPTRDLSTDAAAEMLQGPEGSTVEITTARGAEAPRDLVLRREHVDVPSIDDVRIIDQAAGVGYLKLTCFEKTTSRDLDTALWQLHNQGLKSLIMDLRGNPGGLLTAAVDVSDKFIDQGNIVSTRGRSPQEDYNYTAHSLGVWRMPLVVLIDGDSASAAEIFAGAIRDHHRGTLVGTRSYGKGSVQGIFPLTVSGAGIRLTTAKFFSPDGHPFSHVGVEPDIMVRQVAKPIAGQAPATAPTGDATNDAILSAGLEAARKQLAQR